ncbi:MAG TPA: cytochrome C oxidase subunit IV family protein [Vicinamibacteria bacterium]|nr:cytochrome C oxidase subunit IV family protein [Vicinamibacteria bacterium]
MSETAPGTNPYRIYWITWGLLLMITVAMLAAEAFHLPRIFLALFLLTFMMVKAAMIGGNFMHLRFERRNLSWMVGAGILVTSLILYTFITPESWNVRLKSQGPPPDSITVGH